MRIEVDPDVLVQSGQRLGSIGSQLGMLSDALGSALGSGIASGMDPAGANFGFKYGRQAQEYADALAKATDAHDIVGYMLEATGHNYENADAASTIGGSGSAGGAGGQPGKTTAGDAPTGPSGAVIPPPTKWAIIQPFLGLAMSWPSGNPSLLRVTAAQWRNLATGMSAFDDDMAALKGAVSQQQIPEGERITQALSDLAEGVTTLSDTAKTMAQSIDDFAGGVQDTQDAIRRLMDRISLDGLWDTVTGFLTGDGDDILREIAHDVGELLENFQNQVKGVVGLLEELTIALGAAADAFQKWIRPILVETFGDGVGNALADYVQLNTDFSVGAVTGLINTVSGVVSLADADTWKGMAELAASVTEDPSTLPGVLANMGKQFVAWDKWSGDHPGRAAGEAAFNIGLLFVPGGALSKTGSVAKGLSYTTRLLEEGRLPRFSDLPGLGGANHGLPGHDGLPGSGLPNIPEFRPGAVPDSLVGPTAPNAIDAPTSPASLGEPTGPNTSGGNGSGGGDGLAPDSSGPPRSPSSSGPGAGDSPSSFTSQGISEYSASSHAPASGDGTSPAAGNGAGPASSEHRASSATQDPTTPQGGSPSGQGGGGDHTEPSSHGAPESQPLGEHGERSSGEHEHTVNGHPPAEPGHSLPEGTEAAHELNEAFANGNPTEALATEVSDWATHHVEGADRVVLGRWDGQDGGYIGEARHNGGGTYFDTGGEAWDAVSAGLDSADAKSLGWQVNEQFLRTQMENGVARIDYLLDHDLYPTLEEMALDRAESFSAMEVEFLSDNAARYGYERVGDSWILTKGRP